MRNTDPLQRIREVLVVKRQAKQIYCLILVGDVESLKYRLS